MVTEFKDDSTFNFLVLVCQGYVSWYYREAVLKNKTQTNVFQL